jgi:hypothetical protein
MNRQSVTLRAHDSINLTTGVVTRSDDSRFASATSPVNSRVQTAKSIFPAHREGLAMNDLEALYSAITGLDLVDPCCNLCAHAMTDGIEHWGRCTGQ